MTSPAYCAQIAGRLIFASAELFNLGLEGRDALPRQSFDRLPVGIFAERGDIDVVFAVEHDIARFDHRIDDALAARPGLTFSMPVFQKLKLRPLRLCQPDLRLKFFHQLDHLPVWLQPVP